jgi:hypothetical protein
LLFLFRCTPPRRQGLPPSRGWTLVETRVDFWGRVEKFLDKQIGKGGE